MTDATDAEPRTSGMRPSRRIDRPSASGAPIAASEATADAGSVPPAAIREALDRILASRTFRRSQRHRRFLSHVVDASLAGRHEDLKEVVIGIEVFDRPIADYDPRRDPIVRVEVGRIREKLTRYYDVEGLRETLQLAIPIGGYVPRFTRRTPLARLSQRPLAVLPFTDLSRHAGDAGFAAGLADQLIDTLGSVPGLRVVARFSAFKAHEKESDPRRIGRLLGVSEVIEGSIQRSGSRMRCIAQLSRTRDGVRLWSHRFERDTTVDDDVFAFQDTIADGVRDAVLAILEPSRDGLVRTPRPMLTSNVEARDLFERARYHAQQGTIEGFRKAIELLEQSVALAPDFAQAHSHLGAARANLAPYVFAPTIPSFAKVKASAMKALALDPLDGDARALLGVIAHRIEAGWDEAEPLFREALRVAPNSMLAHTAYAWGLVFRGRYDEAIALAETALVLDPLNLGQRAYNARLYAYAGRYDVALRELHLVLELEPDHLFARIALGITHLSMRQYDLALPQFERVTARMPEHPIAHFHIVCVLALQGHVERARRELDELLVRFRDVDHSLVNVAAARACLGDRDGMLADLEGAARARDYLFVSVPGIVLFDRYRDDPGYRSLLTRHGLALLPPR